MKLQPICLIAALLVVATADDSRADFLIYKIPADGSRMGSGPGGPGGSGGPGSGPPPGYAAGATPSGYPGMMPGGGQSKPNEPRMILSGRIQSGQGKTVSFIHPSVRDPLFFDPKDVEIIKAPSAQQEYNKRVGQAGKDADAVMKAALWALKKGLLRDFHSGVEKALSIDPQHEPALRVTELKKKIDEPLPDNPALEQELRNYARAPGMQVATSKHFILLHDVAAKPAQGKRKNRAQERLELLEQTYESFLFLFCAQDVELEIPRERLKVILFKDQKDFQELSTSLNPALASTSGFWDPVRNVCVFSDDGTSKTYQALQKLQGDLKKSSDEAKKNRTNPDLVRFLKTIDLLIEIDRENADVTAVSHDATYQMAGNTGLLPRHVDIPRWVHEGLATYFEAPGEAPWAGVGAVSQERLDSYRSLEQDKVHSNIDFIVADQVFDFAKSSGAAPQGNGQAWGLTHFLLENHIKEFVAYYRMLGEMPPDVPLNPKLLTELFSRVFGSDRTALDREWRQHMRSLKTDVERLDENAGKNKT